MTISDQIGKAFTSSMRPENFRSKGYYLGMSMIGGCPTAAYDSYFGLSEPDMRLLWYGFSGHNYERGIRDLFLLSDEFTLLPKSHYMYNIEADFDSRYRGHADIILRDNRSGGYVVVDVKSLDWRKFEDVSHGDLPYSHEKNLCQVQAYMDHGKFDAGCIIYTPRDIPHGAWPDSALSISGNGVLPFVTIEIEYDSATQISIEKHAKWLLELIDKKERPDCTCGYCEKDVAYDGIPF